MTAKNGHHDGKKGPRGFSESKSSPIGFCIYCDADGTSVDLTDEHVIPYAFNGSLILTKASCRACAKVTGQIEQQVLRGMLLEARTHLKMRTRRPKQRPTNFPLFTSSEGEKIRKDVSIEPNPMLLRLPNLGDPPILSGKKGSGWIEHRYPIFWDFIGVNTDDQAKVAKKLGKYASEFHYAPT